MKEFKFSELQATAILEMRLQTCEPRAPKGEDELKDIQDFIEELEELLASDKKMLGVIKTEIKEIVDKHGDDRETKMVKGPAGVINLEDLVADEEQVLTLTSGGYVKRTNPEEFRRAKARRRGRH
jgi:DNA gyrase subunit A